MSQKSQPFTGILATPQVRKMWMADGKPTIIEPDNAVAEFFERLQALKDHYGIPRDALSWKDDLLFAMIFDLVPGFQTIYTGPVADALGLSVKDPKAGRKGSGEIPEFEGIVAIAMVAMARKQPGVTSDKKAIEWIVGVLLPELKKNSRRVEREALVSTLTKRLGTARTKHFGPLTRVADQS